MITVRVALVDPSNNDLVPERVQRAAVELRRPRVPEHPALHRVPLLVEERDRDVPPVRRAVADRLPPLEELQPAREAPLQDDVGVFDAARELARGRDLVGALPVLDYLDLTRGEVDLAKATGLLAAELVDEVEVRIRVVTPDRHEEPPSR